MTDLLACRPLRPFARKGSEQPASQAGRQQADMLPHLHGDFRFVRMQATRRTWVNGKRASRGTMRIRNEQRERVIQALANHLLMTGLAETSLRPMAKAAGISDRMLLYYFRDKAEVLACVIGRIADGFADGLDAVLPANPMPPDQLLFAASQLVRSPAMQPSMRLWLDIVAAAARREEPYPAIAQRILEQFMAWLEARIDRPPGPERRQQAALLLAVIDGLALFDMAGGSEQAAAAEVALAQVRFL